jgi:lipopolysaccharide transport system permease protein
MTNIWPYRHALMNFVSQRLTVRYKRSVLGFLWSFLNPLMLLVTYLIVFKYLFPKSEENYSVKLFCTLLAWRFFNGAVMDMSASVSLKLSLIKQVNFPRIILPLAALIANFIDYLLSLVILVVVFVAARVTVNWPYLALAGLALFIQTLFACGLGLMLAALSVYFTDIQFLMANLFQMWLFLSPILYPVSYVLEKIPAKLPAIVGTLYLSNPIAPLMMAYRSIIPNQVPNDPGQGGSPEYYSFLALSGAVALVVFVIGLAVFKRYENAFAKEV